MAADIIMQDGHTSEDSKKLTQINFFLSLQYKTKSKDGAITEAKYNDTRSTETVRLQEEMAVGKAENIAKSMAEEEYGSYRELNADAAGTNKVISAIDKFVIALHVENKILLNTQT